MCVELGANYPNFVPDLPLLTHYILLIRPIGIGPIAPENEHFNDRVIIDAVIIIGKPR